MSQEKKMPSLRKQKIRKNHTKTRLVVFLILAAGLLLTAVFAQQICPYDPNAQDTSISLQPPSAAHPAGTDRFGRDMFSRILVGLQTSVLATLSLVVIITLVGTVLGVLCGYYEGVLDSVVMRISDVCLAFPGLVFALAIAALLNGGLHNAVLALAVISWPKYARIARSQTLAQKSTNYIAAAKLAGSSSRQIIVKHILPNCADGAGRTVFSGTWSTAAYRGTGKYDERRKKHAADVSVGHSGAGNCDFYRGRYF